MASVPHFDRRNPLQYNVDDFVDEISFYWNVKNIDIDWRIPIFDATLQDPAKRAFDAKRTLDNFAVRARINGDDADDNACLAYHILQLTAWTQWLKEKYQGDIQGEMIMTGLHDEVQCLKEILQDFYDRIEEGLIRAGFPEAGREFTLKQMFLGGLQRDVAQHIWALPILTLDDLCLAANNFWSTYHGFTYRWKEPEVQAAWPPPQRILTQSEPIYQEEALPPPCHDPIMDDLADQLAKLTAHVANMEKTYHGPAPPVQKFYRRDRRNELDHQDRARFDQPQPCRNRDNVICHHCQEPGHYASECCS